MEGNVWFFAREISTMYRAVDIFTVLKLMFVVLVTRALVPGFDYSRSLRSFAKLRYEGY